MTFRVLVVDDEPLAREAVANLLRADSEIEAVIECEDGLRAQDAIARERPDIVFLDIEMPGLDGLQLADSLQPACPILVFTTAFNRYAVEAFQVSATDYVLKPFSDDRFREALARAKRRVRERRLGDLAQRMASVVVELDRDQSVETPPATPGYIQRLSLKEGDRSVVLRIEEIVWIEAQDYCVMVHSTRGRHLIRASLTSLEGRLDPSAFVRVHRTVLVNLQHVRETDERHGLQLVLSDGTGVTVSRSRKAHVESLLPPRLC